MQLTERLRRLRALIAEPVQASSDDASSAMESLPRVSEQLAALSQRLSWVEERIRVLNQIILKSDQSLWERARVRWKDDEPNLNLTWGLAVTGDAFIEALRRHVPILSGGHLVEIGPGYGRLLLSLRAQANDFTSYLGLDISEARVARLKEAFADDPRLRFVCADAELVEFEQPIDVIFSSLTFKHFYPSFEKLAANLARALRPGGMLVFDLLEGDNVEFQPGSKDTTFLRWYGRAEVEAILHRAGYSRVAFDTVTHIEGYTRLLVVATK